MSHKTFLGELIHGEFKDAWQGFKNFLGADAKVADALENGWDSLDVELQNALIHGADIVNLISSDFDKVPAEIIAIIKEKYPDLDLDKVKEILQKIQFDITGLQTATEGSLADVILNMQAYFKGLGGKLPRILSQVAQTIASLLSPTSAFGKIVTYIEMAYRLFVKK